MAAEGLSGPAMVPTPDHERPGRRENWDLFVRCATRSRVSVALGTPGAWLSSDLHPHLHPWVQALGAWSQQA